MDQQRADLRRELQEQRRNELGLTPTQALPKEVKKEIAREVSKEFPPTNAEKERDQEIRDQVNKVKDLWKAIAPSL